MQYCLKDNQLLILYNNGNIKENATEEQRECFYCVHNPKTCQGHTQQYGGQYCDWMKLKLKILLINIVKNYFKK